MFNLILKYATTLGVGLLPGAPGTWGSALVCLGAWLYLSPGGARLAGPSFGALASGVTIAALVSTHLALKRKVFGDQHDPGAMVIDEASGQLLALYGLSSGEWGVLWAGFAAFRFFDIVKPFPIKQSQRLPGAWGVVLDDLLAGLFALALVRGGIYLWRLC